MVPRPSSPEPPISWAQELESDDFDSGPQTAQVAHHFVVRAPSEGLRLDQYLAAQLPEVSRTRIQKWITQGAVELNGEPARSRVRVCADDRVELTPTSDPQQCAFEPEAVAFPVVWQDDAILIIDKPAGLVVHPGAGNWGGTLLNGLLAYDPRLASVPRAGIVHRLDAGTSGLMVVARTPQVQLDLIRQLQARTLVREYWALVAGAMAPRVTIDAPLARDRRNPLRFCVSKTLAAKSARTFVRCLAQWRPKDCAATVSWIACRLDTGRTHQIRVHLESIGHPLIGDPLYRKHMPAALQAQHWIARQALHACRLELHHPMRQELMAWSSAPPDDMRALMQRLGARKEQLLAPTRGCVDIGAFGHSSGPSAIR